MVRQSILWVNDGDPEVDLAGSFQEALAEAREVNPFDAATAALLGAFGTADFGAAEVWARYEQERETGGVFGDGGGLVSALDALALAHGGGSVTKQRTGYLLRAVENRPVDGHMLQVPGQTRQGTKRYAFVPLS